MSRDVSQGPDPPPAQYPEHMVYDGSASNSPTSVRTPDNDTFEDLMLDSHSMREFYQSDGDMITTQVSHGSVAAVDNSNVFISQQGM